MSIKDFLNKWKKEVDVTMDNTMISSIGATYNPSLSTIAVPAPIPATGAVTGAAGTYVHTTGGSLTAWTVAGGPTTYVNPNTFSVTYNFPQTDILKLQNTSGKEIVKLTHEGRVIWADLEMNEDEAAQAFSRSMQYSAELKAGITKAVKTKMRDTVFEEIISIAKQKGSLNVDDLTYLLEASKIIEKLKGG